MFIYSFYDKKIGAFGTPFGSINPAVLMRNLTAEMSLEEALSNPFLSDIDVYQLCEFNEKSGEILNANKLFICNVASLPYRSASSLSVEPLVPASQEPFAEVVSETGGIHNE